MKKFKFDVKKIIVFIDSKDDLPENTQIMLEEDINISSGFVSTITDELIFIPLELSKKKEIICFDSKDFIFKKSKRVKNVFPKPRPSSQEEIELISEYNRVIEKKNWVG